MHVVGRIGLGIFALANLGGCGTKPGLHPAPLLAGGTAALATNRPVHAAFGGGDVTDDLPLERTFGVTREGEGLLDIRIAVPGADWEQADRQGATLKVFLDGRYNQDIIVPTGSSLHPFKLMLGRLQPGPHSLRFERNAPFTTPGLSRIALGDGTIALVPPGDPEHAIYAHAPILLSRPESFQTDTPLLMFYDVKPAEDGRQRVRYTYVFTNEDGGTATRALMARWGRTVDIDWAFDCELDDQGGSSHETYQGIAHLTRSFKGKYEDRHPILRTATKNNVFDDGGESPLRLRLPPVMRLDPASDAREVVLDRNPWVFGLSCKELFREDKAVKDVLAPGPMDPKPRIADPRRFLYADFQTSWFGRGVGVGVKLRGYPRPFWSHREDDGLAVNRSGWVRAAVELPRAITPTEIEYLALNGIGKGWSSVQGVKQVMLLDAGYLPVVLPIGWTGSATFKEDGDNVVFYKGQRIDPLPLSPPVQQPGGGSRVSIVL